jgi:hypothetical protein
VTSIMMLKAVNLSRMAVGATVWVEPGILASHTVGYDNPQGAR